MDDACTLRMANFDDPRRMGSLKQSMYTYLSRFRCRGLSINSPVVGACAIYVGCNQDENTLAYLIHFIG